MRFTLFFILLLSSLHANERVVLQLKWLHQFQFAGYYAAKEKGYYSELGLDVEIRERDPKKNNIQQVIDGKAQYGIADSVLFLYKAKGEPVVVVTPILQHSPSVLLSLKKTGLDSAYKLDGKDFIFYNKDTDGVGLLSMLKTIGITPNIKRNKGPMDYQSILTGEADVFAAYLTNEPYYFKKLGIEINIINPSSYGIDLYGDMLFTNTKELQDHPKRVENFRKATIKGWEYALSHKEEIIKLIVNKYSSKKTIEHLRYEADALYDLIHPKSTPIGTMELGKIQYTMEIFKKFGLVDNVGNLDDYVFKSYKIKKQKSDVLTQQEDEYLQKKQVIKMCIDPDWMPFEKIENSKHIGMSSDYFNIFEKEIGYPIELVPTKNWLESLEFGKQRKCDIFSLVMPTQERRKFLDFTKAYMSIPLVVATSLDELFISDISSVTDKEIGVVKGYAYAEILRYRYPKMRLVDVKNLKEGLEKVKNGDLFAFVGTLATVGYRIQRDYVGELKIAGKFDENWDLGVGTRNDEPILKDIFNKLIDKLSAEDKQKILNKWIYIVYDKDVNYADFFKWLSLIALVFISILSVVLLVNRKLSKEIYNRKKVEKELEKAKETAECANRAKSRFLANMSHEIRTPLNAIMGFIELLKEKENSSENRKYLDTISSSGSDLVNIINDILDFSKIESGKLYLEHVDFDPEKEFRMTNKLFYATAKEKYIELYANYINLPRSLNGDIFRIRQVIRNLLSNAIKFSKEQSSIYIDISYKDNHLHVSVKDEGIGISEKYLDSIFESFSQEDSSTTRKYGGTGLGLSISHSLVNIMGGKLRVNSELGKGSDFYFSIPLEIGNDLDTQESISDKELKGHVLLVEDNKANQMFMEIILQTLNLTCDIANDGTEAIKKFKERKYDVILMDENMPNMNGMEATKLILEHEKQNALKHTPIIALTANALKGDREKFIDAGMDEYLTKPVNKNDLVKTLNKYL